ncbi:MAG: chemotaxis protein CheX [Magnetococcales bacterium]|nr:chemotaxis protein CheX [Magnetococcales bacterium]
MYEDLAEAVTGSVSEIFLAFLEMEVSNGPFFPKPDYEPYEPPTSEVVATVKFDGDLVGGVHLSAPLYVALALAGGFAGMELESMDADAADSFGELGNMVAGGVQGRLMEHGGEINLSPPILVVDAEYEGDFNNISHSLRQYFRVPAGPFYVECFFDRNPMQRND